MIIFVRNSESTRKFIFNKFQIYLEDFGRYQFLIRFREIAKKIIEITGSASKIELIPYEVAYEADFEDMERRVPSIEKVTRLIGFEPNENLDDIIREIVGYMKTEIGHG